MAEGSSRALVTGEQVLDLIDSDNEEDVEDGLDEVFFPRSDDELGLQKLKVKVKYLALLLLHHSGDEWEGNVNSISE